jgi:hypothetical protein
MPIVEMKHRIEGEILIFFEYLHWRQDTQGNDIQHNDTDPVKKAKFEKLIKIVINVKSIKLKYISITFS